jgi:hypothetical protein
MLAHTLQDGRFHGFRILFPLVIVDPRRRPRAIAWRTFAQLASVRGRDIGFRCGIHAGPAQVDYEKRGTH